MLQATEQQPSRCGAAPPAGRRAARPKRSSICSSGIGRPRPRARHASACPSLLEAVARFREARRRRRTFARPATDDAGASLDCATSIARPSDVGSPSNAIATASDWRRSGGLSIGTVGDSFDNALAETVNGYYKAELIRGPARRGPWKTIEEVELATLGWAHWHNTQRLHGYLGDLPPAEFEALNSAGDKLDPGVLSVARAARRAAERLPQPHPDPVEDQIRAEPLLEGQPRTATALTASAPMPQDTTPSRAMAD